MCMNNARFISQMLEYHRFTPIILQRYKNLKIPLVKENTNSNFIHLTSFHPDYLQYVAKI